MIIKNENDPLRLREGIPFTLNKANGKKCVTFSSFESAQNGYLILSMANTTEFAYTLTCNTTKNGETADCGNGSNILVKESRNLESINA